MKEFIAKIQFEERQSKKAEPTLVDAVQLPNISDKAGKLLAHIGKRPFRSKTQRYKELGLHPTEGEKAVDELISTGLVVEKAIQL